MHSTWQPRDENYWSLRSLQWSFSGFLVSSSSTIAPNGSPVFSLSHVQESKWRNELDLHFYSAPSPPSSSTLPPPTPSLSPPVAVEIRRLWGVVGVNPRAREDLLLVRQPLSQLTTSTVCSEGCIYTICEKCPELCAAFRGTVCAGKSKYSLPGKNI